MIANINEKNILFTICHPVYRGVAAILWQTRNILQRVLDAPKIGLHSYHLPDKSLHRRQITQAGAVAMFDCGNVISNLKGRDLRPLRMSHQTSIRNCFYNAWKRARNRNCMYTVPCAG